MLSRAAQKKKQPTVEECAKALGVSKTTIDKYIRMGCPRDSIASVKKWRKENIRRPKKSVEDESASDLIRKIKEADLADKLESSRTRRLKNDLLARQSILREEVEQDLALVASLLTNRLKSLGTRISTLMPQEAKAEVKELVDEQVRAALKEMAEGLREIVREAPE